MGTYTYIEAIGAGFPGVFAHALGDGSIYENIVWDGGIPLPSKTTLDEWIAANPKSAGIVLTKYQFRKLFTLNERVAVDNAQLNTAIPAQYRAMLATLLRDVELSEEVQLTDNPDVAQGVNFLEQIGLIGPGRAAQILANQLPTT